MSDAVRTRWRTWGGGALAAGGLLWLFATFTGLTAITVVALIASLLAILAVGMGLLFVGYGTSGTDGAVGDSAFGRAALSSFSAGYLLLGLSGGASAFGVAITELLPLLAGLLIVVGGPLAAVAVFRAGVVTGIPRWLLFLPAGWGILYAVSIFGLLPIGGVLLPAILGALFAVTGLGYTIPRPGTR